MTLSALNGRITSLRNQLDALRPLNPEQERRIMDKFRLDWNYHSNHLEGNQLTYGETRALLLFNVTAQGKPLKDHLEIKGHDEAIRWLEEVVGQQRPLTENFIRELHKLLLVAPYQVDAITPDGQPTKRWVQVGQYKSTPNHVKTVTGEIFRFATPEETPALMHDLLEWYRAELNDPDHNGWVLAATFHYRFIRIHPFDDGNGRLARILMNFILLGHGFPPVVVKTGEKSAYFQALQQADVGNLEAFAAYIGEQLVISLALMVRGAKGESIEEEQDLDKQIALLKARLEYFKEDERKKDKLLSVQQNIWNESLWPFVLAWSEVCRKFEPMFTDVHRFFWVNNAQIGGDIDWVAREVKSLEIPLDKVGLVFKGNRLRNVGLRSINVSVQLQLNFDESGYSMTIDSLEKIYKPYPQILTADEVQLINSATGQFILKQIEQQLTL
jgi:Fic family protein